MFNPSKPHYQCFSCLRRCGFGYDRTAKHFKVTRKKVYKWFSYHGLKVDRPNTKYVNTIKPPVIKPKINWELRFKKSKHKRKIACYLRAKIWQAFRKGLHVPSAQILLGCTIAEFKQHIQSLLSNGMTMQNYGKVWQLDHKTPCFKFNLDNQEERLRCFNFSNYQPLFTQDNYRKPKR